MENTNTPEHNVKVPFDPGWNDPPKISYNAQVTPNKPRNFLNKRVAFPITGTISNPAVLSSGTLPSIPSATSNPIVPIQPSLPRNANPSGILNSSKNEIKMDSDVSLTTVMDILLKTLTICDLGSKSNDIKRRITLMEEMWTNGKLNTNIQVQMNDLAKALERNEPNVADDIHKALMVDYVSVVGTWMPGVKQLIHHCIARAELIAIDKE